MKRWMLNHSPLIVFLAFLAVGAATGRTFWTFVGLGWAGAFLIFVAGFMTAVVIHARAEARDRR